MARARNIKPGFFRNADLVDLPMEARLLFIGLWTLADRSGRMEDRPKQIKMEIFPADNLDCNDLLDQIAATGMLTRYEVDGKRYLQVVNFCKHQNPHRDEKASTIPDSCGNYSGIIDAGGKHGASTVQALCNGDAKTVPLRLIPDPLIPDPLIPDPLIPDPLGGTNGDLLVGVPPEKSDAADAAATNPRGARLSAEWVLPKAWGEWALSEFPGWTADVVRLEGSKFRDHWVAKTGKDASKLDWQATWRNWCRNASPKPGATAAGATPAATAARNAEAKKLLGIDPSDGAPHPAEKPALSGDLAHA